MREIKGNLWDQNGIIGITTNGVIKSNGHLVMGKGIALQAAQRYYDLPRILGASVAAHGNKIAYIKEYNIIAFPTKDHWKDKSDIILILQSTMDLYTLLKSLSFPDYFMTRPGCGNGGLNWRQEVKPVVELIFPDNVTIVNNTDY